MISQNIFIARKRSLQRLCFHRRLSATVGMHGREGHVWWGCMVGGGHAWQGACMAGGVCMAGGMCVRGVCVAGEKATAAGGMHPTGMHSC